jgi:SH3-like domain-containing protein
MKYCRNPQHRSESSPITGRFRPQRAHLFLLVALTLFLSAAPAFAERLAVIVDTANIRRGPGTGYEILWQVGRYYPLEVVERRGDWLLFRDFEGDNGWIHKKLVRDTDAVITTVENCNIRSGPGTNNPVVFTAERGVAFRVLKRQGDWLKIRHPDGDEGWIYRKLVW